MEGAFAFIVLVCGVCGGTFIVARSYFHERWRMSELLVTVIAGSVPAAIFAQNAPSLRLEGPFLAVAVIGMLLCGQVCAFVGSMLALRWIETREISSTSGKCAAFIYGWLLIPVGIMQVPTIACQSALKNSGRTDIALWVLIATLVLYWAPWIWLKLGRDPVREVEHEE